MNDAEIIAATRLVMHRLQMEPADDIGLAQAKVALRNCGIPAATVALDPDDRTTVITMEDDRTIRVWSTPHFEIMLESDDFEVHKV